MNDPILIARNLIVKRGGAEVLDIPAFDIQRGEVVSLVGPNGAGKSSLLLALAQLIPISQGEIFFDAQLLGRALSAADFRRRIAMVFQEPLLLNQSVYDNAAIGLKLRGAASDEIKTRVMPWLEKLGIAHLAWRSARTLSGGEAQRTSLARALTLNPDLLLLDEPFAALDAPTRAALTADLENILEEMRITTLFVTHDRMEAYTLSHRMAVMLNGRMVQLGEREEVLRAPCSRAVAELMGVTNFLDGVVIGCVDGNPSTALDQRRFIPAPPTGPVPANGGRGLAARSARRGHGQALLVDWRGMTVRTPPADFPRGARVTLCIRPEEIWIWKPGRAVEPDLQINQLSGEIVGKRPHGAVDTLLFRAHGLTPVSNQPYDLELQASYRASQRLGLDVGANATVALRQDAIHVLPQEQY